MIDETFETLLCIRYYPVPQIGVVRSCKTLSKHQGNHCKCWHLYSEENNANVECFLPNLPRIVRLGKSKIHDTSKIHRIMTSLISRLAKIRRAPWGCLGCFISHRRAGGKPRKKALPGWVKAYIPGQTADGGGAVHRVGCRS